MSKKKVVNITLTGKEAEVLKAFVGELGPIKAADIYDELWEKTKGHGMMSKKRFRRLVRVEETDAFFKLYEQL